MVTKKMISYIVLSMGLLIFSVSSSYAIPTVQLVVPDTPYVNEVFGINVQVSGVGIGTPIVAFRFESAMPLPSGWTFEDYSIPNPPFQDDSVAAGGFPTIAGSIAGDPLADPTYWVYGDNIRLATLKFKSDSTGNFSYNITSDISTASTNEGLYLLFDINIYDLGLGASTDVTVNSIEVQGHPVPEPGTLILMGVGLLALSGLAVKKTRKGN